MIKKSLWIILIMITGIFGIVFGQSIKKCKSNPQCTDNNNQQDNGSFFLNSIVKDQYIITYTEKTPENIKKNTPSIITLYENGNFSFNYNNCDSIQGIFGKYEIDGNKLTLTEISYKSQNINQFVFTYVSENELYLNSPRGCVIDSNSYNEGYGSFKRVK